jgi:alpha-galactosidase
MRTPRVNFEVFRGDENRGMQLWRRWYFDHILPREDGRPLPPKHCGVCLSEGGASEFAGATEAGQIRALETYLSKGIHPDLWWIDAGWYSCGGNWQKVGTWRHDPVRFPGGLGALGGNCHKNGVKLLLWFEPERVTEGSEIEREHPEWLLWAFAYGEKGALLNLGEPACCDDLIERIDRAVKEYGVDIYRQDFNMNPEPFWVKYETADRIGAMENLHVQGVYRLWDTLLLRNPGLWIDCCSSGGRRNDLEMMRRAVPLHFTDVGYGYHPMKQEQHRVMFEWIPYFRAQNQNWENPADGLYYKYRDRKPDRYSYHNCMAPAFTEMMPWDASEEDYALSREMLPIWRRAAEITLNADYYPLTECRKAREDFYAMYFYNPDEKKGFLQAIRNNACPEESFTAYMTALDHAVTYRLTNPETGEEKVMTGEALAKGFNMTVEKRAGQIWFFEKA